MIPSTQTATVAATPVPRSSGTAGTPLRGDIQTLRTLAVLGVVLFHLWPHQLKGGYAGVDVFFVISGFLITSHLVSGVQKSGTVRVSTFWARRAVRLLPSALLVIAVSIAGTLVFVPAAEWPRFLQEAVASTLYVENWYLAAKSIDYLAADSAASPVQHFWSLSVEEQFYIVLPLLILLVLWMSARRNYRRWLFALVALIVAASFAYGVYLTGVSSTAYFSTLTRAWEFGAGALLAFLPSRRRWPSWIGVIGCVVIVGSYLVLTQSTPFPGSAALLPVLGAVAVIGARQTGVVEGVGRLRPISMIARSSYAIYLWHWPLIVFAGYAFGTLGTLARLSILAASVLLGWLSTRYWEEPLRFSKRGLAGRRPRVVAAWMIAGGLFVIGAAGGGLMLHNTVATEAAKSASDVAAAAQAQQCLGAESIGNSGCDDSVHGYTPALSNLQNDDANLHHPGCWSGGGYGPGFNMCTIGDPKTAKRTFLVLGDSHSNNFIGAYERMAREKGWAFKVAGHSRCYLSTAELTAADATDQKSCDDWRSRALAEIGSEDVDGIIVTRSTVSSKAVPHDGLSEAEAETQGLVDAWAKRKNAKTPVIVIRDNPAIGGGLINCLQAHSDVAKCGAPEYKALKHDVQVDAAARSKNVSVIDLTRYYCVDGICPAVIGNVVMYRDDGHHLTNTYIQTLEPHLAAALSKIVG